MHTRRFLHSLTVVAAAAALSMAAHTTSVAAAEGDDGNGSRAPQWEPAAAIHERRRDDDGASQRGGSHDVDGSILHDDADGGNRQSDVVSKPASASNVHAVPAVSPVRSQPLAGLVSSSGGTVVARAPVSAARAQASAAPQVPPIGSPPRGPGIPTPNPPVLSGPPVPVAPPAFGPAVLRTQAPPLNLAIIVTLAVGGGVALLAVFLARKPV